MSLVIGRFIRIESVLNLLDLFQELAIKLILDLLLKLILDGVLNAVHQHGLAFVDVRTSVLFSLLLEQCH